LQKITDLKERQFCGGREFKEIRGKEEVMAIAVRAPRIVDDAATTELCPLENHF